MKLVLDAGALIGIDRDDRRVAGLIELARRASAPLITTAPVVGEVCGLVWGPGARQARLSRALAMVDTRDVGLDDARAAGDLLGRTATSDVVDALVVLLAVPGDQILTSDRDDLARLVDACEPHIRVVAV